MTLRVKSFITHPISQQVLNLFVATNGQNIEYVDHGPADVVFFDPRATHDHWQTVYQYPADINVCLDLAHAGRDKVASWANYSINNKKNYVLLECRDPTVRNPQHLYVDFIFNRSKAYFADRLPIENSWYFSSSDNFDLWPIESDGKHKTKLFLSPNKLLRPDLLYRISLADFIQHYYIDIGYFSNVRQHRAKHLTEHLAESELKSKIIKTLDEKFFGQQLMPQHTFSDAKTVSELLNKSRQNNVHYQTGGYNPVHNAYYKETFFSVYCETIEVSRTTMVTEKTLDPLIKGHFILPFGSTGTVAEIQRHGFRLPDFIDYSYDSISDDCNRFFRFLKEFKRLAAMSMDQWNRLWVDNQDILHYNRNVFFQRDYSRVDFRNLIESAK